MICTSIFIIEKLDKMIFFQKYFCSSSLWCSLFPKRFFLFFPAIYIEKAHPFRNNPSLAQVMLQADVTRIRAFFIITSAKNWYQGNRKLSLCGSCQYQSSIPSSFRWLRTFKYRFKTIVFVLGFKNFLSHGLAAQPAQLVVQNLSLQSVFYARIQLSSTYKIM